MVATTSHIFSGKVDIASNLQVGSSHLFVDTENSRIGITTANPDATLHVNGNVYATRFEGDGSLLTGIASNLEQITNNGNVTSNAVQFTNPDTGIITTGNVDVGNKLSVASLTPGSVPYIDGDNILTDSHITQGTDKVSITSNLEITGNILVSGETYKIDSQSLEVKDRIVGIAYDNTLSGADTGILMEYPTKNIGLIHHGASGNPYAQEFTIGYTQNTATDTTILNDPANKITVNVLGDLHTQNNMTVDSGGSYFGDGTTLTGVALATDMTSNAARIANIETVNGTQTGLITGLRTDMTSNASRMTTLETANTVQAGLITSIKSDVTSNTARIATLEAANTVQASLITAIETDVTDNASRITTLEAANTVQAGLITAIEADVTDNASRITTLEAANTVQTGLITAIEADVTDNAARITTLEAANTVQASLITAIETDVTDNAARITTLEAANTVQSGLITAIETDVADNATRITNLDTSLTDNASRVTALEATDAVYSGLLTGLRTDVDDNDTRIVSLESANTVQAGLITGLRTDLEDTFITKTSDSTIISSNLEVTGNIFMRGDRFVVESETTLINDAIIGIANNNTVSTTDVGILMQRPTANVALVHHGGTDTFTIGYTQDTLEATDITNDTTNEINVNVLGQLHVQNNMTVGAGGSYFGDGTTLTGVALLSDATSNVTRIANLEASNVDIWSNLYSNVIRIETLEDANTVQAGLITTLTNDLSDNAARITTLEDANTVQGVLITTVTNDLSDNAARITTLEDANTVQGVLITTLTNDLSDNAGRITTLEDANTVQGVLITTVTNDLSDNAGRITTLEDANTVQGVLITTVTNDLSDNAGRITTLEDANTVQGVLITTVTNDLSDNAGRITTLEDANTVQGVLITTLTNDLSDNAARIAVLDTDMTSNSGRIDALEPRVTNLEASNVDIWSNLALLTLDDVVNVNNATSNTVRFTNATTSLTASGNVTVSGNVTSTTALISNAATLGTTKEFVVTVSGGVFYIDGVQQPSLELHQNQTYLFDLTDPGTSHPFRLATVSDGGGAQNGSGSIPVSDYTTGTDYTSVANHLKFTVPPGAPSTLYYYCTIHSGMGGNMSVSATAELIVSGRVVASGNVEASSFKGDGSQLTNIASNLQAITDNGNVTSNTVQFTNTGTSLVASGTVEAVSFVGSGSQLTDIASNLEQIVNNGNVTSNTLLLTHATTGLVATGNVEALKFIGDGSELTNIASNLEQIANNGNVTSNTLLLTHATTGLVATGNVHAFKFIGDGSALSNLPRAGVWEEKLDGEIYFTDSNVGISNTDPGHNLSVGSNLYVDDDGSNVLVVTGNVKADYFLGDGSALTNIASNLEQIANNGNVTSNTLLLTHATTGLVATGNVHALKFIGDGSELQNLPNAGVWDTNLENEIYYTGNNVGISNADPGHNLSVGSNLYVDDDGSNVLVISGNAAMSALTLGQVSIVASYGLDDILNTSNISSNTMQLTNATTGLVTTANVEVGGELTVSGNVEVGTANLFVDTTTGRVGIGTVNPVSGLTVSKDIESSNSFITERVLFKETWPNGHNSLAGDLGTWVVTNLNLQGNPTGGTTTPDGYTHMSFNGVPASNGEFVSPAFDLSDYAIVDGTLQADDKRKTTTRVFMKCWFGTRQLDASGEVVQVQFSPDDGSTWYTVATSQDRNSTNRFTMVSADLSPYILETSTNAKIRFYMPWSVANGDYIRIGRIWIHESDVPTNLGGMWLGAGGNIGIGTTNPRVDLEIENVNGSPELRFTDPFSGSTAAWDARSNVLGEISWYSRDSQFTDSYGKVASITSKHFDDGWPDGALCFTTSSNGVLNEDAMVIDQTGNVGIGVTDPGARLDVNGDITVGVSGSLRRTADNDLINIYAGSDNTSPYMFMTGKNRSSNANKIGFRIESNAKLEIYTDKIFIADRVGIGYSAPDSKLDLRNTVIYNGETSTNFNPGTMGLLEFWAANTTATRWNMTVHENNDLYFLCRTSGSGAGSWHQVGYLMDNTPVNNIDFTGQHRNFIDGIPATNYTDFEGLIVSANKNKYFDINENITTGADAIQISQSLPLVSLSSKEKDKACFGVISGSEDPESREYVQGSYVSVIRKQKGDTRAFINSVGEGAIWVTNINGSLESGDYITTSNVAGYGQKQDSDSLKNYTVAKITMDCDFDPVTQPVQIIRKETSDVNYWVKTTYENVSEEEYSNLTEESRRTITETVYTNEDGETFTEQNEQSAYTERTQTLYQKITVEESKTEQEGYELEVRNEPVNVLDEHGQIQWEDDPSGATEKAYKIRYLDANGNITDEASHVHKAAFVGCTYHCG